MSEDDAELCELLTNVKEAFQDEVSDGLPPERDVDHDLYILPGTLTPHPLYQLSPADLVAARGYTDKLLGSGKLRARQ